MWKPNDDKWGPAGLLDAAEFAIKERVAKRNPNVRRNFNSIIGSLAGKQFSAKDVENITREVISNISPSDAQLFKDVRPSDDGILRLDARQLKAVGRLISGFPHDDLGMKVRNAYDSAVKDQRIRVRPTSQRR